MLDDPVYKIKVHYDSDCWSSIIDTEIPTKDELNDFISKSGLPLALKYKALEVISQCDIPQTPGEETCDEGSIVVSDISYGAE